MKISVITVVYNGAETIGDCIKSVLEQTYNDIEYVIVDGNSNDGTQDIVQSYGDRIHKFVSESDNGIYDAMNKGVAMATGEIIAILNADDMYAYDSALQDVVDAFSNNSDVGCVYGDLHYVGQHDISNIVRVWKSKPYTHKLFRRGWHPAHPSFFVKKSIYDQYGLFDTTLPISADYEIMLRFLEKEHVPSLYIPRVFVTMRTGGTSNRSFRNIIQGNREVLKSWKKNGLRIPYQIFFLKPLSKLFQIK